MNSSRWASWGTVVLVGTVATATPATAQQGVPYSERTIFGSNPGGTIAPPNTSMFVPIPFTVPKPEHSPKARYRTLDELEKILSNDGDGGIVNDQSFGPAESGLTSITESVLAAKVTTRLPFALPRKTDQTEKGRAIIISGFHPNEWMAIEGVTRKLEAFQSRDFKRNFDMTAAMTALGKRDLFFAENVVMLFVPVMNPDGLVVAQKNPETCEMVDATASKVTFPGFSAVPITGLQKGRLTEGRMRRKNLKGSSGIVIVNSSAPNPTALSGVDINRNLTGADNNDPADFPAVSFNYRGWDFGADPIPTPETVALYAILDTQFARSASYPSSPPSIPPLAFQPTDPTGTAVLDVHTARNDVEFSGLGSFSLTRFQQLGNAVARAAYGPTATAMIDTKTNGDIQSTLRVVYGIPNATLELPRDSLINGAFGGASGGFTDLKGTSSNPTIFATVPVLPTTEFDLGFLVGPDFNAQRDIAARAIDATLDFAAGPPYVRQVVIVKGRATSGSTFDISTPGNQARVVYWGRWDPVPVAAGVAATARTINQSLLPAGPPRFVNGVGAAGGKIQLTLAISFSKPMRDSTTGDPPTAIELAGTGAGGITALLPLVSSQAWVNDLVFSLSGNFISLGGLRYEFDTWIGTIDLPAGPAGATFKDAVLRLQAQDQSQLKLDGNPATVATYLRTTGDFTAYEDQVTGTPNDGGIDANHGKIQVDTVPPRLVKSP